MKAGTGHSLEDESWAQAWAPLVSVSIRVASLNVCVSDGKPSSFFFFLSLQNYLFYSKWIQLYWVPRKRQLYNPDYVLRMSIKVLAVRLVHTSACVWGQCVSVDIKHVHTFPLSLGWALSPCPVFLSSLFSTLLLSPRSASGLNPRSVHSLWSSSQGPPLHFLVCTGPGSPT